MTRVADAVRRLASLTEEQVAAARTLRGERLSELNERRVDALFDLRLVVAENGFAAEDRDLEQEVRRLAAAEHRLATIARHVLDLVARIDFTSPALVYDRAGRLG